MSAWKECGRRSTPFLRSRRELCGYFYFDEQPHSEIARALGIPLGTVKSRVRLAVARLRAQLEDLG